jgi:hypothetical protein
MNENLNTLLQILHQARVSETCAKALMSEMVDMLQARPDYQQAKLDVGDAAQIIEVTKAKIENLCLPQFAADGNKQPHDAITIKEFDVVTIPDETKARYWCFTDFHAGLKFDANTFKKEVKTGNVPAELATVTKEARVQIAADLSEFTMA